jgi:hypothetical protein
MDFLARNSRTHNASCTGALSWQRTHLSALPDNTVDSWVVRLQWIHSELSPYDQRNTQAWPWTVRETYMLFFGRGEFCVFRCMLRHFVSGSYWKHISSPVMILSDFAMLYKRSDEMWSWHFWISVKILGTVFAENFLIPKSSIIICHTVSLFIFNSSAVKSHT